MMDMCRKINALETLYSQFPKPDSLLLLDDFNRTNVLILAKEIQLNITAGWNGTRVVSVTLTADGRFPFSRK